MDFLSFAKNIGKNISKNLSARYSQKRFDHAKQHLDLNLFQKEYFKKQWRQLVIGKKIANKIMRFSKNFTTK